MKQLWRHLDERKTQSGQALAEAGIVFILVLMFLAGLVEFGWAYFRYLALQSAAGEGAAYGIVFPTWWHGDASDPDTDHFNDDPNNIIYRVKNESKSDILDWSNVDVTVEAPFTTPGNPITVTARYEHDLITPLLSPLVPGGSITLRATAVQRILSPPPSPSP
ncbi:MAG TPA: TadE/TadG family type IV pilus assembly protein [Candidatus Sulfomarinibacteraceae bacterium]|nr:TadE/TadG family type IV pilus assembly protein [Candidatus Sulfomarinibacteraceae bacterium]